MKKSLVVVLVLVISSLTAHLSFAAQNKNLGVLLNLNKKSQGPAILEAIKLAVQEENRKLRAQRKKYNYQLIVKDTKGQPEMALQALKALHEKQVQLVFGPQSSSESEAVLSFANKNKMLLLSPSSTASSLAKAKDSLIRFYPSDESQTKELVAAMAQAKLKAVSLVVRDDLWGEEFSEAFKRHAIKAKLKVVSEMVYSKNNVKPAALVPELLKAVSESREKFKAEGSAVFLVSFDEALEIMSEANRYPLLKKVQWWGPESIAKLPGLLQEKGALELAKSTHLTTSTLSVDERHLWGRQITTRVQSKLKRDPHAYSFVAFDMVRLALKSLDDLPGEFKRDDFVKALFTGASSYKGVAGPYEFDKAGDRSNVKLTFWTVKNSHGRDQWVVSKK